ncbi:type II toxin-antitoxin system VapC family toxin [Sphingomonas sp.]|uniref:type II toxin-antitoxin system VapC family toxin n=1 Tax=Sphingomonas sp. TaxID=28214 RepID=UPI002ED8ECF6
MIVVVDASSIGAFLIPDEAGTLADFALMTCLANEIYAPPHLPVELASLIGTARKRNRLDAEQSRRACADAVTLMTTITLVDGAPLDAVVDYAIEHLLSAYDAAYALVCERFAAPLLTGDGRLARAAIARGIAILTP